MCQSCECADASDVGLPPGPDPELVDMLGAVVSNGRAGSTFGRGCCVAFVRLRLTPGSAIAAGGGSRWVSSEVDEH